METQEMFNTMMENAIVYLQNKGLISSPKSVEVPETKAENIDYANMVRGLKEEGLL